MIEEIKNKCFDWGHDIDSKFESFLDNANPSVMPYAIRAFGLQGIYPYVKNSEQFKKNGFKEALEWHTYRGTPRSFIKALEWAGIPGCLVHEVKNTIHWTDYSIEVPRELNKIDLEAVKGVCRICEPSKSRLTRIFKKASDVGMLVPSTSQGVIGENIPSNNSGYCDDEGVLISQ